MYNGIVIDIETTGLNIHKDELLQVSIIDDKYNVLFSEYIKPVEATSWLRAEKKNHISPEMVKDKQPIDAHKDKILNIINNAKTVIGYNIRQFDIPFLERVLEFKVRQPIVDVMLDFSKYFSLYEKINFKLEEVCNILGVVNKNAHDALSDVIATLDCYNKMLEEAKKPKLTTVYKFPNNKMIYSKTLADEYSEKVKMKPIAKLYLIDGKPVKESEVGDLNQYRKGEFVKPKPGYADDKQDPQLANYNFVKGRLLQAGCTQTVKHKPLEDFNDGTFILEPLIAEGKMLIQVNKDGSIDYKHNIDKDRVNLHFQDGRQWQKWAEDNTLQDKIK